MKRELLSSNKFKTVFIAIGVVTLCAGTLIYAKFIKPQPPKKEDLPTLSIEIETSFLDPQWKSANIRKICIDGDLSWPKDQQTPFSLSSLRDMVEQLGYEVGVGNMEECDAYINLQLAGKPLSARYSWAYGGSARSCLTGYEYQAQFELISQGLSDLKFNDTQEKLPPKTVQEDRCETDYQAGLRTDWNLFLNSTISSIWGEMALIAIDQNAGSPFIAGVCERGGLNEAKIEYLDLYIQKLMENEEFLAPFCIDRLNNLGTDAKKAVPFLLYLLDTVNTDHGDSDKEDIFEALRSITGENIDDSSNKWWGWWEDQQ